MALPQRAPKPEKPKRVKRDNMFRSERHKRWVRTEFACVMCGSLSGRQFAHLRLGTHTGMSMTPHDYLGTCLCAACHHGAQHQKGEATFWAEYERKHGQTVWELIDSLCAASPVAREIREWRKEHENV